MEDFAHNSKTLPKKAVGGGAGENGGKTCGVGSLYESSGDLTAPVGKE